MTHISGFPGGLRCAGRREKGLCITVFPVPPWHLLRFYKSAVPDAFTLHPAGIRAMRADKVAR